MSVRVGDVVLVEAEVLRVEEGYVSIRPYAYDEDIAGIVRQAFRVGDKIQIGAKTFEIRAIDGDTALVRSDGGAYDHVSLKLATRVD